MPLTTPSRRRFLLGAAAVLAAPALVRVSQVMPISPPKPFMIEYDEPGEYFIVVDQDFVDAYAQLFYSQPSSPAHTELTALLDDTPKPFSGPRKTRYGWRSLTA